MSGPANTAHSGNVEQYYHNTSSISSSHTPEGATFTTANGNTSAVTVKESNGKLESFVTAGDKKTKKTLVHPYAKVDLEAIMAAKQLQTRTEKQLPELAIQQEKCLKTEMYKTPMTKAEKALVKDDAATLPTPIDVTKPELLYQISSERKPQQQQETEKPTILGEKEHSAQLADYSSKKLDDYFKFLEEDSTGTSEDEDYAATNCFALSKLKPLKQLGLKEYRCGSFVFNCELMHKETIESDVQYFCQNDEIINVYLSKNDTEKIAHLLMAIIPRPIDNDAEFGCMYTILKKRKPVLMEVLPTLINLSSERNNAEVLRFLNQFDLIDYTNKTFVETCPVIIAIDKVSLNTIHLLIEKMKTEDIFHPDKHGNNAIYHIVTSIAAYHRPSINPAHRKTAEYKTLEGIALVLFKLDQNKTYFEQTNPAQSSALKIASNTKKTKETIKKLYKEAVTPAKSQLTKKLSLRGEKSS